MGGHTVDGFAATLIQALYRVALVELPLRAVHIVLELFIMIVEFAELAIVVKEEAGWR